MLRKHRAVRANQEELIWTSIQVHRVCHAIRGRSHRLKLQDAHTAQQATSITTRTQPHHVLLVDTNVRSANLVHMLLLGRLSARTAQLVLLILTPTLPQCVNAVNQDTWQVMRRQVALHAHVGRLITTQTHRQYAKHAALVPFPLRQQLSVFSVLLVRPMRMMIHRLHVPYVAWVATL